MSEQTVFVVEETDTYHITGIEVFATVELAESYANERREDGVLSDIREYQVRGS